MEKINYDIFICTKPFQWINIENIEKTNSDNILIIIENFPNALEISNRIKENHPYWKSIILVKNRLGAFLEILKYQVRNLYVDSDYGRKSYLYAFKKSKLFVYDEGIGTYSVNLKEMEGLGNKLKYPIFCLIGAATFQGGGWKTSGIFVYNIPFYNEKYADKLKSKAVLGFGLPLEKFLIKNIDKILNVFQFNQYTDVKGKRILLYITFHSLREEILEYIETNSKVYDLVIIKPHPHLLRFGDTSVLSDKGFEILNSPIMAEVLIIMLSTNNHVTVLHESSSACLNLTNSDNVEFIDFHNKLYLKDFGRYLYWINKKKIDVHNI